MKEKQEEGNFEHVVKTWDGRPWVQKCFRCTKTVNFIKDGPHSWIHVGNFVRHAKCKPEPYR